MGYILEIDGYWAYLCKINLLGRGAGYWQGDGEFLLA